MATGALAQSLDATRPPRVFNTVIPGAPNPDVIRQGGDTWEDALEIPAIPYITTGTNVGYSVNCCMEMCPYEAWGPAVFYKFTPSVDVAVRIDLCGSDYDTGLYVFTADLAVEACNIDYYDGDDECGNYVSCLEYVALAAGQSYYIVVTGMSGASGNYNIAVTEVEECVVEVSGAAVLEGEPQLVDGYVDQFNGGCNSPEFGSPMQQLVGDSQGQLEFAGRAGWFLNHQGLENRDTDWFTVTIGPAGMVEAWLLAELSANLFELGPQNCESVGVVQIATSEQCNEAHLEISGEPGDVVWLWVGSTTFSSPFWYEDNEFNYRLILDGLAPGAVTVQQTSWSSIRSMFR